jgi:hypothetical protein
VIAKKIEGAPHETLLVLDATTGQNAMCRRPAVSTMSTSTPRADADEAMALLRERRPHIVIRPEAEAVIRAAARAIWILDLWPHEWHE